METSQLTSARRRSISLAVIGVSALGVIHLMRLIMGTTEHWLEWAGPFAFFGIAYLDYRRYLRKQS